MRLLFILTLLTLISSPSFAEDKKYASTYDRVMDTGVLRCGYAEWAPIVTRDPNTGKFSGVYVDYMEAMGRRLGLKIEWAYELNISTYLQDMKSGKYDVECSGGWPNARREKFAEYTTPLFYTPIYLFTATGNKKFDKNYSLINQKDVRFVTMPGEQSEDYRNEFFPLSTEVSVPPTAMLSEILLQIITNKGDVAFWDMMSVKDYMKQNPDKIRQIEGPPVKVIPNNLSVSKGEFKLLTMLNIATEELIMDGVIETIMKKHGLTPDVAFRPKLPYEVSK